jgi:hypothetical protein
MGMGLPRIIGRNSRFVFSDICIIYIVLIFLHSPTLKPRQNPLSMLSKVFFLAFAVQHHPQHSTKTSLKSLQLFPALLLYAKTTCRQHPLNKEMRYYESSVNMPTSLVRFRHYLKSQKSRGRLWPNPALRWLTL